MLTASKAVLGRRFEWFDRHVVGRSLRRTICGLFYRQVASDARQRRSHQSRHDRDQVTTDPNGWADKVDQRGRAGRPGGNR